MTKIIEHTQPTPEELLKEVGTRMWDDEVAQRTALVRNMLMKQKQLGEDISKDRKALAKKETSLTELETKIEKFKSGDWSVLEQFNSKPDGKFTKEVQPESAESK